MHDLVLTPSGHLSLIALDADEGAAPWAGALARAFAKDPSEGLLQLATLRHGEALPAVFAWWRRFGEVYLTALCHIPEPSENLPENLKAPLPPPEKLDELAADAPPMRGGEYLRPETLERLWIALDAYARTEIRACKGGLSEWLRERSPLWHRVGRVCFHLAENRRDAEYPFAFLATYAPRLIDGRRVQYQPLGRALSEYAGAKNKTTLQNLLTPVQRAAERLDWVRDLVESGEVFHPLRWTPAEAYRLLQDAPLLEESGLLLRLPDWWTKRPRVRVGVTIGSARQSRFNADAMLDFKVGLAIGEESLSEMEWRQLLAGSDGLVFLKGRWVEVDRERLAEALRHWKQVEKAAGDDGVSFLEGMRLLAGAPIGNDEAAAFDAGRAEWSETRAGDWLAERLRELRSPPPVPIGTELQGTLRPYQEAGVAWLRFLTKLGLGACLADDMGLGKTVQVISLLLLLKHEPAEAVRPPALLVLPASLLANWKAELARFAPTLAVRFAHPALAGAEAWKQAVADPRTYLAGADVVLTSYGMLARQPWLVQTDWRLAVLDEAQAIKNPASRQAKLVKQLRARARIALTGTPVENRLSDLWSIFDFLSPGLLGSAKAFGDFVKRLERAGHEQQYAPLRRLVGPYILRRLKTDKTIIADLPDKTEMQSFCHLTKRQAALYEQSVRELAETLRGVDGIQRRGVVLAFLMRFKQICNHPAQWLGSGDYKPEGSGKFERLRELGEEIASRQEKALVFTQFREIAAPLADFLGGVFGRPGLVLHGQIAVSRRRKLVEDFQREDGPPFFVLSLKAGGIGLNLTAASHVIHFDRWWNPAVENQATDRAFRIGQKRNVMVHKFVCRGTIEEKIDALIRDKAGLAGEILEGGAPRLITEMGDRELLDLVRLDATTVALE